MKRPGPRVRQRDRFVTVPAEPGPLCAALFAIAAVIVGVALQVSDGSLQNGAIGIITLAFVAAIVSLARPSIGFIDRLGTRVPIAVMAAGLAVQFGLLLGGPPGIDMQIPLQEYAWFQSAAAAVGVFAGLLFVDVKWTRRLVFPLLLAAFFGIGLWMLKASPSPAIDVALFHQGAFDSLINGRNPHEGTIANLYGDPFFYGPGMVQGGRVLIGHPYPPLSLFITFMAHQATGDYRTALLVAMVVAAAAVGYSRSTVVSFAAATLFLFTPRALFVLEQGWTDPLAVMAFAVTAFVGVRKPAWLWVAVGLLFAIKQYLVGLAPLAFLLWPGRPWQAVVRELGKAVALAAVVTAPIALWNVPAFVKDVVLFQVFQPFRSDSLSYLAYFARSTGTVLGAWVGFVAAIPVLGLAVWRASRSVSGFAAASAVLFFTFVVFNKQAFTNYYYFIIAVLATAAAVAFSPNPTDAGEHGTNS